MMIGRWKRVLVVVAVFATGVTGVTPASADATPADKAAAEALFDQAKQLVAKGNYADACPKFEESQRLDAGVGTMLFLADCFEQTGRTASAWALFREAAAAAKATGRPDREKIARDSAAALEPKLSRLTIAVSKDQRLEVRRDGVPIGQALWGSPIPVDPGAHTIEALAPGKEKWSTKVEVGSKAAAVTITVPILRDAPASPAASPPVAGVPATPPSAQPDLTPTATGPSADAPAETTGLGTQRAVALVAGGVGVVGVVVGAVFGLGAKSSYDASGTHCHADNTCDGEGLSDRSSAFSKATVSTVAFAVGGVGLAGGVALWLTAPSRKAAPRVGLSPVVGPNGTGWAVRGAW